MHWPLSRRWEYALEVCSRWPKEILENVGVQAGEYSGYRKAGTVKTRQENEINWEMSVNQKSIEQGPIE